MPINHVNVRCSDLERTRTFLEDVVGLVAGDRPNFKFPGYWMYDKEGGAVMHLIATSAELGEAGAVDHVAFGLPNFDSHMEKLAAAGYQFSIKDVPGTDIRQAFIVGPDGLQIELQGKG